MIVRGREDAQVVGCSDGSSISWLRIASSERISSDSSFANIVATFGSDNESLMANTRVEGSDGSFEQVGKEAGVDIRLLVMEIELSTVGLLGWKVVGEDLGLETLGEVVFELDFGIEGVGRRPCLGQGKA